MSNSSTKLKILLFSLTGHIKKYKQYIKEDINYSEVEPWGEEDWEMDELTPVLQKAR
jgi:hypothetical protein